MYLDVLFLSSLLPHCGLLALYYMWLCILHMYFVVLYCIHFIRFLWGCGSLLVKWIPSGLKFPKRLKVQMFQNTRRWYLTHASDIIRLDFWVSYCLFGRAHCITWLISLYEGEKSRLNTLCIFKYSIALRNIAMSGSLFIFHFPLRFRPNLILCYHNAYILYCLCHT